MTRETLAFRDLFEALTSYSPMRWQCRLFHDFRSGKIRGGCDLPTGLGKTSVIPTWLIALASQAGDAEVTLPRRLVYIVNRRTVVDQATDVVERRDHAARLHWLCKQLRMLSATQATPLAISTLRGELADNEEWKTDPARPAIIVGTIDMIGSKLLFSGYGDGSYKRAHHAGLMGQDSLIIHDEAHLTPAFSELLRSVAEAQLQSGDIRPINVQELSATTRASTEEVITLLAEDEEDKVVQQRLDAQKRLRLHKIDKRDLTAKLTDLARQHEALPSKVLIYVSSPESAQAIARALISELNDDSGARVALLTGTIRGYERDRLVREDRVYQALLNHDVAVDRTMYLVSTSAGEVGIDLDADHLVCDLTAIDSMIQRLGRVNRRGGDGRVAEIDVVVQDDDTNSTDGAFAQAVRATRALLARLPTTAGDVYDASPRGLRELLKKLDETEKRKAFSPKPELQPLTDILLDAWSLTSIVKPMPGRPEVGSYLHGLTSEPPETYVAWRKEVVLFDEAVDAKAVLEWFRACRIETQERLRNHTERVKRALQLLLSKHRKGDKTFDSPAILLNGRGDIERSRLSEIADKEFSLSFRTVVLPVEVGGLGTPYGTLDGSVIDPATDVAEIGSETRGQNHRERWLLTQAGDDRRWERLLNGEKIATPALDLRELVRVTLQAPAGVKRT